MPVSIVDYLGRKVMKITLDAKDRYPFTFGLRKAKMMMAHVNEIKEYIDKYDVKDDNDGKVKNDGNGWFVKNPKWLGG